MNGWARVEIPRDSDVEVVTSGAMLERGCADAPELTAFAVYVTCQGVEAMSMRVISVAHLASLVKTLAPRTLTMICTEEEDGRDLLSQVYALVRDDVPESRLH
jgi:hypothetical protein